MYQTASSWNPYLGPSCEDSFYLDTLRPIIKSLKNHPTHFISQPSIYFNDALFQHWGWDVLFGGEFIDLVIGKIQGKLHFSHHQIVGFPENFTNNHF